MSSYGPPASRMRQIKRDAPPPIPRYPQNVEEAIAEVAKAQAAGEVVADEIRVPVGIVDAVVKPGPDEKFGTADDVTTIEPHEDDGEHEHDDAPLDDLEEEEAAAEELVIEDEPVETVPPEYNAQMKKSELLDVAETAEVETDDSMTKAQIIEALDAKFGV
jgi:hypothetical protein